MTQQQKVKHSKVLRWTVLFLVIGLIAAGDGYIGSYWTNQNAGHIPIQKVDTNSYSENLDCESLSSTEVAQVISSTVVSITTEQMKINQFWFGYQIASGVFISEDDYILTCTHVVSDATTITATTSDGKEYPVKVVGGYPAGDIAVLKMDAKGLKLAWYTEWFYNRWWTIIISVEDGTY